MNQLELELELLLFGWAEDGAAEEEALTEATLHSTGLIGNFDPDAEDEQNQKSEERTAVAVTTRATRASDSLESAPSFPLQEKAWLAFVQSLAASKNIENSPALDVEMRHTAFTLEVAFEKWKQEAVVAGNLLLESHNARKEMPFSRNLSLLCIPLASMGGATTDESESEARFVHWQAPGSFGRPVQLDENDRVKALVCVGALQKPMDLAASYVIQPDVGVSMQRVRGYRKQERPQMTANMLRLQSMCNRALQAQCDGGSGTDAQGSQRVDLSDIPASSSCGGPSCALCGHRAGKVAFGVSFDVGQGQFFQCPCCLGSLG